MSIKGYKAFNKGLICNNKQYEENTVFEETGMEICKPGVMHFCENPFDVLNYYPLVNDKGEIGEFSEVEALGDVYKLKDKSATNKLKIGLKLNLKDFIKACIDFTFERVAFKSNTNMGSYAKLASSGGYAKLASSGDYAQLASSGNYAQLASSGGYAQLASSGNCAQLANSGNYAKLASSGSYAQLASSGDCAQLASSGDGAKLASSGDYAKLASSGSYAKLASSGDFAQLASSGNYAKLASSGDCAQLASSGDFAKLASSGSYAKLASSGNGAKLASKGKHSVVAAIGIDSVAKAKIGNWITLVEWIRVNDENGGIIWTPKCVKTEFVDGERIKEDTFYKLVDGEFKAIESEE